MNKPIVPKKYLKLYNETARNRILKIFFTYPEKEFSLSELAREAGVAKANIGKILNDLYELEIIEITKLSKIWRIKSNQNNWGFIKGKIVYNLDFIYQSGIVKYLNERYRNPKSITLFGSFRDGTDISCSDIDIAIESNDFKKYTIVEIKELYNFKKIIDRRIQVHEFNRQDIDINLFNSIANGIVLLGFLKVRK